MTDNEKLIIKGVALLNRSVEENDLSKAQLGVKILNSLPAAYYYSNLLPLNNINCDFEILKYLFENLNLYNETLHFEESVRLTLVCMVRDGKEKASLYAKYIIERLVHHSDFIDFISFDCVSNIIYHFTNLNCLEERLKIEKIFKIEEDEKIE